VSQKNSWIRLTVLDAMFKLIKEKLAFLMDKLRRKVAYVPAVSDTVKSLQDVGLDLTEDQNGET